MPSCPARSRILHQGECRSSVRAGSLRSFGRGSPRTCAAPRHRSDSSPRRWSSRTPSPLVLDAAGRLTRNVGCVLTCADGIHGWLTATPNDLHSSVAKTRRRCLITSCRTVSRRGSSPPPWSSPWWVGSSAWVSSDRSCRTRPVATTGRCQHRLQPHRTRRCERHRACRSDSVERTRQPEERSTTRASGSAHLSGSVRRRADHLALLRRELLFGVARRHGQTGDHSRQALSAVPARSRFAGPRQGPVPTGGRDAG